MKRLSILNIKILKRHANEYYKIYNNIKIMKYCDLLISILMIIYDMLHDDNFRKL